jgi:hypothetical protein
MPAHTISPERALLKYSAAARHLGVTVETLDNWRGQPELGLPVPLRIGRRLFFVQGELEAWLASRREGGPAHA